MTWVATWTKYALTPMGEACQAGAQWAERGPSWSEEVKRVCGEVFRPRRRDVVSDIEAVVRWSSLTVSALQAEQI